MLRTRYVVEGDGPWVVLIHGVGLDLQMWSRQARTLETRFRVLRYDLIGHGDTPPAGDKLTLSDLAGQLHELLGALGVQRASLVGFSLGALVAQAFTLEHSHRVERLVIANGIFERSEEARAAVAMRLARAEREGPDSIIDAALARWFSDGFRRRHADAVEEIATRLRGNSPAGFLPAYRMFASADPAPAGRLNSIQVPTLVVTGELDEGSTPEMARRMSEEIPDARLRIFPAVRHMLPIEAADEFNALLCAFLSGEELRP